MNNTPIYITNTDSVIHGCRYLVAYHIIDYGEVFHEFMYYFKNSDQDVCFIRAGWYFWNAEDSYYQYAEKDAINILGYLELPTNLNSFMEVAKYKKFSDEVINAVLESLDCSLSSNSDYIIKYKTAIFTFYSVGTAGSLSYELKLYPLFLKYNNNDEVNINTTAAAEEVISHLENIYLNNTIRYK